MRDSEENALIRAGERSRGAVLYCTDEPCDGCMKLIKGAGISTAIWYGGRWDRNPPKKRFRLFR